MKELNMVSPELVSYVEKHVFPVYKNNDEGHQYTHIKYVINRSLKFAQQFGNVNYDICYVAAAFHDIGHHIDRKKHEIISAQMFMEDENMKKFFSEAERIDIKEAIEDHRASLQREPRSVYGKILSSADRSTSLNDCMQRVDAYTKAHYPDSDLYQRIQRAYEHISKKFGPGGYVKSYVQDPELDTFLKEVDTMLKNKSAFVNRFIDACGLYPEVGVDREFVINLLGQKYYRKLEDLHRKKYEVKFYNDFVERDRPFVIEFTGTPRTGKTTIINALSDFFKKGGFNVCVVEELTSSYIYKNKLSKEWKNAGYSIGEINKRIMWMSLNELRLAIECNIYDIIIVDRGISDRQVWNYIRFKSGDFTTDKYNKLREVYEENAKKLIDMLVITSASPNECIKRDFRTCISLEKRNFITVKNVKCLNNAMRDVKPIFEKNVSKIVMANTDSRSIDSILLSVTNEVISAMKEKYSKSLEF